MISFFKLFWLSAKYIVLFLIFREEYSTFISSDVFVMAQNPLYIFPPDRFPDASLGTPYSNKLSAECCLDSEIIFANSTRLPPGMTIDMNAYFKGTPTQAGEFTFTINAYSEKKGIFENKDFSLHVYDLRTTNGESAQSQAATISGLKLSYAPRDLQIPISASQFVPVSVFGGTPPYTFNCPSKAYWIFNVENIGFYIEAPALATNYTLRCTIKDSGGKQTQFIFPIRVFKTDITSAVAYTTPSKTTGNNVTTIVINGVTKREATRVQVSPLRFSTFKVADQRSQ